MTQVQLVSKNPIVIKFVEGDVKEDIYELLLAKNLPFTEEENLESLVFTMSVSQHRAAALELLKNISDSTKAAYVEKHEANHRVAFYVLIEALNWKKPELIARAIKNQALPFEFLLKIAEKGDESMLEMLMDNQIKLIAYPEIMVQMEKNPEISAFLKGRIKEIREYYLSQDSAEEISAEDVLEDIKKSIEMEQQNQETESVLDEDDEDMDLDNLEEIVEEKTLTTLQEINNMNISERIKLAFSGNKTCRMILVKDPNKMVSLAVIESPKLTLDEVVLLVKNKGISGEIIGKISRNREYVKKYPIILELVQNPKTPVKEALAFIKKLHIRDLRGVTRNKNISPVIRNLALNFYSQKTGTHKK